MTLSNNFDVTVNDTYSELFEINWQDEIIEDVDFDAVEVALKVVNDALRGKSLKSQTLPETIKARLLVSKH